MPTNMNATMKQSIIYLVDDDEEDRVLMQEAFKTIGLEESLVLFANGEHLMNHLETLEEQQLPHLVVLDYNMPKMNGIEVLTQVKNNATLAPIKIVMYTTSINEKTKKECMQLGALECFIKPTDFTTQIEIAKLFDALSRNPVDKMA